MKIIKYLIGIISLTSSLFGAEGGDGWFPVERRQAAPFEAKEENPAIWVLFVKRLEGEKVSLKMPKDPSYQSLKPGFFEVFSEADGETFRFGSYEGGSVASRIGQILGAPGAALLSLEKKGELEADLVYSLEGQGWVRERLLEVSGRLYSLQTVSGQPDSEAHARFVASFQRESAQ